MAWEPDEAGGRIVRTPEMDVLDDGPAKPVRIGSRVGRRPILAVGNANGDILMLQFAAQPGRPSLPLLVLHDDRARVRLHRQQARANRWTVRRDS